MVLGYWQIASKKRTHNMQTKLTVSGNCEILRELNETPLEYGSLHGKNQDQSAKLVSSKYLMLNI